MRRVIALMTWMLPFFSVAAQSVYFISIDADDQERFQVTLARKTYSSDSFGHLVIPQLSDAVHPITVHFLSGKYSEHVFMVRVEKADRGFQLKKKSDDKWVLYDWQKMELLQSEQTSPGEITVKGTRRSDEFARLMAAVVNDSSVLIQPEELVSFSPGVDSVKFLPSEMTPGGVPVDTDTAEKHGYHSGSRKVEQKDSVLAGGSVVNSERVEKLMDDSGSEYRSQLYRDSTSTGVDSVLIKIPLDAPLKEQYPIAQSVRENESKDSLALNSASSVNFVNDTISKKKQVVMVNSDCRFFASDADIERLRVQMLGQVGAQDRTETARRVMRTKCFLTSQVRALSELFTTDEGRYRFFDAAYPYVSDSDRFRELIDQLSDEYYRARFKALVRF